MVMAVAALYVSKPGGDDERARIRAERAASRARVRARYAAHLVERTGLDDATADLVMAVLFDHPDEDGEQCRLGKHPSLPDDGEHSHDAGFDCPCTWDAERRESERDRRWKALEEWWASPEAAELNAAEEQEMDAVDDWVAAHPGVEAKRTCWFAPEQWEGRIDGRSFYFRERHGMWRIEIDIAPDGTFVDRYVGRSEDGEMITEPVELTSGEIIAEGMEGALGDGPVEHLRFIVETVRAHLNQTTCTHPRAERYCPACGARVDHAE